MLYFNLMVVYLKTARFELNMKRYFPIVVLILLLLEMFIVLKPTLNMRASIAQQWCEFADQDIRVIDGWLYSVMFSYFLPLVASIGPSIYLTLRLKEEEIIKPKKSQVFLPAFYLSLILSFVKFVSVSQ